MMLSTKGKTFKTLVTSMPMVEIDAYFSAENVRSELKWIIDAATNATNVDKVKAIQAELESRAVEGMVFSPLSLTFAVKGKPTLSGSSSSLSTLSFNSSNTYIVGNLLTFIAICRMLGIKTFLFSSRLSAKEIYQKSLARQRLAMENVEVRVIFDDEKGLEATDIVHLFKKSSLFDSALNLPHISEGDSLSNEDDFPLRPFILRLIEETKMNSYGGVSFDTKHVKVSESSITTQYILFKLIVGAVAGASKQEYSKMSKDLTLENGRSITSVLADGYIKNISAFISGWLEPLKASFKSNRSGYQLSPQVWQSLGLVIHRLINDGMSIEELTNAGRVLGSLDYSKNAKHWKICPVMELDSQGRIYKNAASSTRLFRVGLQEYFLKVINGMTCLP
ncbi:hypothetical protein [Vibrio parahaemolyticus]|uniref:hypothetical protein n=1 Tax=Vibrio parahaemolyticus TaxID=670 RepID=UPI0035C7F3D2|nr:hypothetical protein [Vibrio parahaemolyticus]EHH2420539.1 hypothetical protein [Vibrio parahaemolyticus]EHK2868498.1 hypothetical protein [Vibrio parahaemolyticus]